jgi:hypothetical protein
MAGKLETVQIAASHGQKIFCNQTKDVVPDGEVKMHERRSLSGDVRSSSVLGLSVYFLATMIVLIAQLPLLRPALADDATRQTSSGSLANWQCYAAWHPSWHYIAVQDEETDCL